MPRCSRWHISSCGANQILPAGATSPRKHEQIWHVKMLAVGFKSYLTKGKPLGGPSARSQKSLCITSASACCAAAIASAPWRRSTAFRIPAAIDATRRNFGNWNSFVAN